MNNLPDWVVSIIAVAVGLSPGLAVLSARSIARLLYWALSPYPDVALGRNPTHETRPRLQLYEDDDALSAEL
jgi:hypothetical protein